MLENPAAARRSSLASVRKTNTRGPRDPRVRLWRAASSGVDPGHRLLAALRRRVLSASAVCLLCVLPGCAAAPVDYSVFDDRALAVMLKNPDPAVRVGAWTVLAAREVERLGPVEFLAGGVPTACDADGDRRREIAAYAPPDQSKSPDGKWRTEVVGDDVWAVYSDGMRKRLTNEKGRDAQPAWSPDGRYVAVTTARDGDDEIYLVNVDTLRVVRLTHCPARDHSPRWSANGSAVFFVSDRDGRPQIYRVNRDRTNLMRVSDGETDDEF